MVRTIFNSAKVNTIPCMYIMLNYSVMYLLPKRESSSIESITDAESMA